MLTSPSLDLRSPPLIHLLPHPHVWLGWVVTDRERYNGSPPRIKTWRERMGTSRPGRVHHRHLRKVLHDGDDNPPGDFLFLSSVIDQDTSFLFYHRLAQAFHHPFHYCTFASFSVAVFVFHISSSISVSTDETPHPYYPLAWPTLPHMRGGVSLRPREKKTSRRRHRRFILLSLSEIRPSCSASAIMSNDKPNEWRGSG